MAQKNVKTKSRQIGKTKVQEKKPLIDPRYKNTIWTLVIIVILTIFFIINNTRPVPDHGPYPPGFNPQQAEKNLYPKQ
jgi:hypothetical protein